jgi:predicted RNA-binding Zn-ribbon protein involved in translation (DUF1610 family)
LKRYPNRRKREDEMATIQKTRYACDHCGAEADMILEGFESVEDVVKKKKGMTCKNCGKEIKTLTKLKEPFACDHCGAEADMTLEGFEKVEMKTAPRGPMVMDSYGNPIENIYVRKVERVGESFKFHYSYFSLRFPVLEDCSRGVSEATCL